MVEVNVSLRLRPAPGTLKTLPDILRSLASLETEENTLSESLTELLTDKEAIDASIRSLRSLTARFDVIQNDAVDFTEKVASTADTARRVGGRVKILDEEMKRVKEAADRVGQVMELKTSLADIQSSIDSQDWEAAARYCAKTMSLPLEVIAGPFSESSVPTMDLPLPPVQVLQDLREQLRDIFLQQFREASQARDANQTTRFFKLFPPIGWEQEGLQAYASFVVDLMQTKSPPSAKTSSPLYYVTALTALFESVCSIVDQHKPVVEKYYGRGKMHTVAEGLMEECDKVVERLLEGWEEERALGRKLADIMHSSNFMQTSPATTRQTSQSNSTDDDGVDPRQIDAVLSEAAALTMRYSAFRRFLYGAFEEDGMDQPSIDVQKMSAHRRNDSKTNAKSYDPASMSNTADLIENSVCQSIFARLLDTFYVPMELWYLRRTINQAHRLSTTDFSQSPFTTSVPDLVFYLLKTVITRLLSTGSLYTMKLISARLRDVIEHDYIDIIKSKLDDVYRAANPSSNASRFEKSEKENKISYIVLLNDLDVSALHMERLRKDALSSQFIEQNFMESEEDDVTLLLTASLSLESRLRTTLKAGIDQLFNQLIRPRLRNLIPDVYKDVSYVLDDDSYSSAEYQDIVRKRFIKAWDGLTEGFKGAFTETNYRLFFGVAIDVLLRPWEKYILTLKYSELGAIRFDHDIRAISAYLSSKTTFGDIREKFQRLQQISTLLNIDKGEDVDEFFSSSGISWKLNFNEARSIVGLRI